MASTSPAQDRVITLDLAPRHRGHGHILGQHHRHGDDRAGLLLPAAPTATESARRPRRRGSLNFILVDHKMRALFSILFGASMLLVIERAKGAGQSPARVHFARMAALLLFGLLHFYLIWWGDILTLYAVTGMIAFLFWRLPATQPPAARPAACWRGTLRRRFLGARKSAASRTRRPTLPAQPTKPAKPGMSGRAILRAGRRRPSRRTRRPTAASSLWRRIPSPSAGGSRSPASGRCGWKRSA